jgi:hypothetical protein
VFARDRTGKIRGANRLPPTSRAKRKEAGNEGTMVVAAKDSYRDGLRVVRGILSGLRHEPGGAIRPAIGLVSLVCDKIRRDIG